MTSTFLKRRSPMSAPAAFDTSRFALYRALNLRLPENSTEEPYPGTLISQYLWRGDLDVTFTKTPKDNT